MVDSKAQVVANARKEKRQGMSTEERQIAALEMIADNMEEIKTQLFQINTTLGMILRKS